MEANKNLIPNFVQAGSPQGLRLVMLKVAARLGAQVHFHSIQWVESRKKWFAWYSEDFTNNDPLLRSNQDESE